MLPLLALLLCSGAAFSAESGTRAKGACLLVNAALRSRAQQQPRPPSPRSSFRSSTRSAQDAGRLRAPFLRGLTSTAAARCESRTAVACPLTPASQGAVRLSHAKLERLGLGEEEKCGRSMPAAFRPHSCLRPRLALPSLLRADGFYRARVPANVLAAGAAAAEGRWVTAFLPARCWVGAGGAKLAEAWILQSDEAGNLITVELTPPGGACVGAPSAPTIPSQGFASSVTVRLPKEAPTLAGQALLGFSADAAEIPDDGPDPGSTAGLGAFALTTCDLPALSSTAARRRWYSAGAQDLHAEGGRARWAMLPACARCADSLPCSMGWQ